MRMVTLVFKNIQNVRYYPFLVPANSIFASNNLRCTRCIICSFEIMINLAIKMHDAHNAAQDIFSSPVRDEIPREDVGIEAPERGDRGKAPF